MKLTLRIDGPDLIGKKDQLTIMALTLQRWNLPTFKWKLSAWPGGHKISIGTNGSIYFFY
jgi:hypothetical protein